MKKFFFAALLAMGMMALPSVASAHVYDRDDSDHPLRYVAYAVHPVGMAVEYTVLRPIHWLVSRPALAAWFGHCPDPEKEKGTYMRVE